VTCHEWASRLSNQLSVLTTSRIPLGVATERIYAIPPLSMISAGHDPNATDATALFVDRATGVAPPYALTALNGPTLADICRTLHGLPLAIELAASWIRVLSPRDLLASLTKAHAALGSDWAAVGTASKHPGGAGQFLAVAW
jgi:predicted ATPase